MTAAAAPEAVAQGARVGGCGRAAATGRVFEEGFELRMEVESFFFRWNNRSKAALW